MLRLQVLGDEDDSCLEAAATGRRSSVAPATDSAGLPARRAVEVTKHSPERDGRACQGRDWGSSASQGHAPRAGCALQANRAGLDLTGKSRLFHLQSDAGWTQIAREQIKMLHDDVGTVLARTAYHEVARGFGAEGIEVRRASEVEQALGQARALAARGRPVLVNVWLDKTDFREGSISM